MINLCHAYSHTDFSVDSRPGQPASPASYEVKDGLVSTVINDWIVCTTDRRKGIYGIITIAGTIAGMLRMTRMIEHATR